MTYEIFDPGVDRPLHKVSREDAIRHFKHFVQSIEVRIRSLGELVVQSDQSLQLNFDPSELEMLDTWFQGTIEGRLSEDGECIPTALTFSVCNDLGMYLGEMLRRCSPRILEWKLVTENRRDMYYQRPVIRGFSKATDPLYGVDFDHSLCMYAHAVVAGAEKEEGVLKRMFEFARRYV